MATMVKQSLLKHWNLDLAMGCSLTASLPAAKRL